MIRTAKTDCSSRRRIATRPDALRAALLVCALMYSLLAASAQAADPPVAPAPAAAPQANLDLLAAGPAVGSEDGLLWVARIVPGKADPASGREAVNTRFYVRQRDGDFAALGGTVTGRAIAVATRGNMLAVLMDDGSWFFQGVESTSVPSRFPANAGRLLTIASDDRGIYGIARVAGGSERLRATTAAAATSPASQPTSTRAATAPGASFDQLTLAIYREAAWSPLADLPPEIAASGDRPSLAVVDGSVYVLTRPTATALQLWRLEGTAWQQVGQGTIAATARSARLVPGGAWPTALITPGTNPEPDRVLVFDGAPSGGAATRTASAAARPPRAEVALNETANRPVAARTAVFAFTRFRSIVAADDQIIEQGYDLTTLAPSGTPTVSSPREPGMPYVEIGRWIIVIAGMIFIIVASVRRREQIKALDLDPSELPLAPIGVRLLAGLIDASPLIAALFIAAMRYNGDVVAAVAKSSTDYLKIAGVAGYLILTTTVETLAGRSLGKMLCGLQVVTVDGSKPTRRQLLTRNLLRLVDVGLEFVPLLLVPFSPLRQRAGDAAAGTLVITTAQPAAPPTDQPEDLP